MLNLHVFISCQFIGSRFMVICQLLPFVVVVVVIVVAAIAVAVLPTTFVLSFLYYSLFGYSKP